MLYGQHNPRWITADNSYTGMISVFNNGDNRPAGNYSSVEIINPVIDANGYYTFDNNNKFFPDTMSFSWHGDIQNQTLNSIYISSFEVLKNDKLFICEGISGRLTEMDDNGNLDWLYKNPVSDIVDEQGSNVSNWVFKTYKIEPDYLTGIELLSDVIIEDENTISDSCTLEILSSVEDIYSNDFSVQLLSDNIKINAEENIAQICLIDLNGRQVDCQNNSSEITHTALQNGVYVLQVRFNNSSKIRYHKVLIN